MSRKVSLEQRKYVIEHFATDSNKSIIEATGLSIPSIYRIAAQEGIERSRAYRDKAFGKIQLTDKQYDYLIKHFKDTDNGYLATVLNISETTLHRMARRFGLKKSKSYMKRCQAETAAYARYANEKNGTKPQKGVYNENLQKGKATQFKPGENNRQRNGVANERRRIISSAVTRRETIAKERRRIRLGLPQETKLKLKVK